MIPLVVETFVDVIDGEHVDILLRTDDGAIHAISLTAEEAVQTAADLRAAVAQRQSHKSRASN